METVIRVVVATALLCATHIAIADDPDGGIVYGGDPENGWGISFSVPANWTFDCCRDAAQRDANLLVFPKNWSGQTANGVIVLRVWKKKRETLNADWNADAESYEKEYPNLVANAFDPQIASATCRGASYTSNDNFRDYVVFCDPGEEWNYRLSWSMLIGPDRDVAESEAALRRVAHEARLLHVTNKP
jgi:hypothetical protein